MNEKIVSAATKRSIITVGLPSEFILDQCAMLYVVFHQTVVTLLKPIRGRSVDEPEGKKWP